eukprot:TRINITY_DN21915_c0_g1_i2.p1 TRINITY_DN21915_c0_g1~~TRINITY_DN21915_c0_g1_i2.p1  ORF type:complete len:546 (+),score=102.93 TRINITY_DN21915_c0_g1_i2:45-1682(+)
MAARRSVPQAVTRGDAISEFTKYTNRLRDGHQIPPPSKNSVANTDFNIALVLRREFLWKHPRWIPYTKAEGRLPVGSLHMLSNQGWKVGVLCWAAVIQIFAELGKVRLAEDAYRNMIKGTGSDKRLLLTSKHNHKIVLEAMLWLYTHSKQITKFKQTWQYMASLELDFCPSCYAAAATIFQRCGLEKQARNTLHFCIGRDIPLTGMFFAPFFRMVRSADDVRKIGLMYAGLVDAPLKAIHVSEALAAITELASNSEWSLEKETEFKKEIASVIEALSQHTSQAAVKDVEQWVGAFQSCAGNEQVFLVLFGLLQEHSLHFGDPDPAETSSWHNILRACVRVNCIPTAELAFSRIANPGAAAYADLIGLYKTAKRIGRITQLWKSMEIEPNRLCYSLYIEACGDQCGSSNDLYVKLGELLFQQATDRNLSSGDLFMFAMMMRLYLKAGDARKARLLERHRINTGTPKGKHYQAFFRQVSPGPLAQSVWIPISNEKEPTAEEISLSEQLQDDGLSDDPNDIDDIDKSEITLRRERIRKLAWSTPTNRH